MLQGPGSRLLSYYILVMMAILIFFSVAFYLIFSHSLYRQLGDNLKTLAQVAGYSFGQVSTDATTYFENTPQVPWQGIFNPEQQGLEWFDGQKKLITAQGRLKLGFPPQVGLWTLESPALWLNSPDIKTFTLSVSVERADPQLPTLEGYIRSSQNIAPLRSIQNQLLKQLLGINLLTLVGVTLGGIWLTKKALEPVEQSFQELKQFTGDASHELRTPLTAIKTNVDLMRKHPERFPEKDNKKLEAIARATEQMTSLTEDLLFLARTQRYSTTIQGEWQTIGLHHLLSDLCEWLEPLAEEKHISLDYRYLAQADITGDAAQLTRLFRNLLENAVFYTPAQGSITLRLTKQNPYAVICVEDTGIGIAPENLSTIFHRFWREDQARTYRPGGTGLGLSIVKAITERHQGKITVNSQLGVGTCFQVFLPLRQASASRQSQPRLQRLWRNLARYQGWQSLKKLGLVLAIAFLTVFPLFLLSNAYNQLQVFNGIKFTTGIRSFADEVVAYQKNKVSQTRSYPAAILGIPQTSSFSIFSFLGEQDNQIVLESDDSIVVQFKDNILVKSRDSQPDLYIFFAQETSQYIKVEISPDGYLWQEVGWVNSSRPSLDIDKVFPDNYFFSFVRLTNPPGQKAIALDAVGAISSIVLRPDGARVLPIATTAILLLGSGSLVWLASKLLNSRKLKKSTPPQAI